MTNNDTSVQKRRNPSITGVMAVTTQGIIGCDHKLPWYYFSELEHFRRLTDNSIVVMGHNTYKTIPRKLLHRWQALVLSRDQALTLSDARVCCSLAKCLSQIEMYTQNMYMYTPIDMLLTLKERTNPFVYSATTKEKPDQQTLAQQNTVQQNTVQQKSVQQNLAQQKTVPVFMIGGAQVSQLFWQHNLLTSFVLTVIHADYSGDTRLDPHLLAALMAWPQQILQQNSDYTIYLLQSPRHILE